MCEQCLTEAVNVSYHREPLFRRVWNRLSGRRPVYYYVAIATKGIYDFEPGDVLVGQINDPEMILSDDLFDYEEWDGEGADLDDDTPLEESPLASDRLIYREGAMNIFHPDYRQLWRVTPSIVKDFERVFGAPDKDFGKWSWSAWVIVKVAEIFQEKGIPYDKEGRLQWALANKEEFA